MAPDFGQLKVAGAFVVLIATFGLVVYDADWARRVDGNYFYQWQPWSATYRETQYQCSIAIAVIGAVTVLLLLVAVVLTLLGISLKPIVLTGLFGCGAILFIGVLVAAAIAVDTVKWGGTAVDLREQDKFDNTTSSDLAKFLDALNAYVPSTPTGTPAPYPTSAPWADPSDVCQMYNFGFPVAEGIAYLKWWFTVEGQFDNSGGFPSLTYYTPRYPLPEPTTFYGNPPSPRSLFAETSIRVCYGTAVTSESLDNVAKSKDLCDLKLTAKECGPGWEIDDVEDYICKSFTQCVKREEERKALEDEWKDLGAVYEEVYPGQSKWLLPAQWNQFDDLKSYWRGQVGKELAVYQAGVGTEGRRFAYVQSNLTFLVSGAVGWVLLVVGLVAGLLGNRKVAGQPE
jgi:hypothetical protein